MFLIMIKCNNYHNECVSVDKLNQTNFVCNK